MTVKTLPLLDIELNLPDYTDDLIKADDAVQAILIKFNELKGKDALNDYWHDKLYEDNSRVLNFVASLSQPVFNIENKLEAIYTRMYLSDPINAKHTWYKHYEQLHQPFTLIKNRCWRIYDMLDLEYFRLFPGMFPPNWDKRLYVDNVQGEDDGDQNENMLIDDDYTNDYSVVVKSHINTKNKPSFSTSDIMNKFIDKHQKYKPHSAELKKKKIKKIQEEIDKIEKQNKSEDQLLADKLSNIISFMMD